MDKNVFIQNLKDTTTVLQQLEVCIEQLKECIDDLNLITTKYNHHILFTDTITKAFVLLEFTDGVAAYNSASIKDKLENTEYHCTGLCVANNKVLSVNIISYNRTADKYILSGSYTDLSGVASAQIIFNGMEDKKEEVIR